MSIFNRKITALACAAALAASPAALAAKQQDYEQLQRADADFKYDGYFRAGFAIGVERPTWDGSLVGRDGGDCVKFQAAGTPATYRLGNECDDYGEVGLHKRVYTGDEGEQFWIYTRMAYQTEDDNSWAPLGNDAITYFPNLNSINDNDPLEVAGDGTIALREFFAEGQDVIPFWPGAKVWAGRRFYQRQDIHINDFFFWDTSGSGIGVEEVPLGPVKGHFAVMRTNDSGGDGGSDQRGVQVDARLSNINTNPNGQVTGGLSYIYPTTEEVKESSPGAGDGYTAEDGWAISVMHQQNSWLGGGFNKLALQYGRGALGSPWTVGGLADEERIGDANVKDWSVWRVVELMTMEPAGMPYSAMFSAVYQDWTRHDGQEQRWISFGFRPQWHITEHIALVGEASHDRAVFTNLGCHNGDRECDSKLTKFTIAPTISAGDNFFGRPQIRIFATHAKVDNQSSWAPLENDSYTTYGVQAEAWW